MKTKSGIWLIFLVFLLSVAGCATLADARKAKGKGTSRVYDAPFETVWNAASETINELGLSLVGENKQERYILAEKKITALSYGEKVAVFVDEIDDERTKVEVVSKKAMATNVLAWNWEKPILNKLDEILQRK